jgi:integrase
MSSLRKDKRTGIYWLDIRINGTRKHVSLATRDRAVAKIKVRIIERDAAGVLISPSTTLDEFEKEYFIYAASLKASRTIEVERTALRKLKEVTCIQRMQELTPQRIDMFVSKVAESTSPATVNYYIRTLRSIFRSAVRWQSLASNPFDSVKQLRFELAPPRILTRAEIRKIFVAVRESVPGFVPLFQFYLLTGMRRKEVLTLQWPEIDFERNVITVRHTKGKKFRYVPMLQQVVNILRARQELLRPFNYRDDEVTKTFKACAIKAKISDTSLHDLRRSFSSYLSEAGIPPAFIQKWLGHEDYSVTDQHYLGTTDEQWRAMLNINLKLFKN